MVGSTVVLYVTITLLLPGMGAARSARLEFPDRFGSITECGVVADRLRTELESPQRHVEAACEQQM